MIFYAYFFCCLSQNNYLCALIFSHLLNMQSHPTWVRGLKHTLAAIAVLVAMSHPTWVRGLKLCMLRAISVSSASHPTWVRGLKLEKSDNKLKDDRVAPYVGAWIETLIPKCKEKYL